MICNMLQQQFITMSDSELTAYIQNIYCQEAENFETTVDRMFDMNMMRLWFRLGCPSEMSGMSPALIKFASLELIKQGLLD